MFGGKRLSRCFGLKYPKIAYYCSFGNFVHTISSRAVTFVGIKYIQYIPWYIMHLTISLTVELLINIIVKTNIFILAWSVFFFIRSPKRSICSLKLACYSSKRSTITETLDPLVPQALSDLKDGTSQETKQMIIHVFVLCNEYSWLPNRRNGRHQIT